MAKKSIYWWELFLEHKSTREFSWILRYMYMYTKFDRFLIPTKFDNFLSFTLKDKSDEVYHLYNVNEVFKIEIYTCNLLWIWK